MDELTNARPAKRVEVERAKASAEAKLRNLIAAVENGAGAPPGFAAIKEREQDIHALMRQLEALSGPPESPLAIIPTWVRSRARGRRDAAR